MSLDEDTHTWCPDGQHQFQLIDPEKEPNKSLCRKCGMTYDQYREYKEFIENQMLERKRQMRQKK